MKIVLGADHAGYDLKESLKPYLSQLGFDIIDIGTFTTDSVDYPDIAAAVADKIVAGDAERGVLICGSGIGASIAANKIPGIRAAIAHDHYSAAQGVEHDNMNVLTLGGRIIGTETAKDLVTAFLNAEFSSEERHQRRVGKINALEEKYTHSSEG